MDWFMPMQRAANNTSMYSTFSLWDTYRNLHTLMDFIHPGTSHALGESLMAMAEKWSYLPPWQLLQSPSKLMSGDGGSIVLAAMAKHGILDKKRVFSMINATRRKLLG